MQPKKAPRNLLAEHITSYLKTYKVIVKSVHVDPQNVTRYQQRNLDLSVSGNKLDFFPFLPYSMNKKKRWEVENNMLDFLEKVQMFHNEDSLKMMVLERVRTCAYDWPHYYEHVMSEQFRVHTVQSLLVENSQNIYKKTSLNSVYGQGYRNFSDSKENVIAYHILRSPKNYGVLFAKKCISKKSNDWPYTTGWQRVKRREDINKDMELCHLEVFDDETCFDKEDLMETEEENVKEFLSNRELYYNLEDHVVKKRRKRNKSENSLGKWIIV